ncbi:hypothetical protein V7139_09565 [Neobacillus drentensis]|uniref:hypothetical protein n=1 Tax=Neobacillus drentensis TaxID=220684 RepID=UPI0030037D7C
MSWQRLYNFQAGTKINSGQLTGEFNQLIASVNALEGVDNNIKSLAQMMKITTDTGAVKLNITDATKNLLAELVTLGIGLHSFYAVDGTVNLPNAKSSRGLFHQTGNGVGWVFAFDYTNNMYYNYLNNGTWLGWKRVVTAQDTQDTLWTGPALMMASTTVTPTKKLSECRTGWILIWSDWDPSPSNTANNYDFAITFIPKEFANLFPVTYSMIPIVAGQTTSAITTTSKRIQISNDKLVGHDDNGSATTSSNDVVLRNILEY